MFAVDQYMPRISRPEMADNHMQFKLVRLDSIFDLKAGNYHNLNRLAAGKTPVVSCGDLDNGICVAISASSTSTATR